MCDICQLKCESCKRSIETHIGDFSVSREEIKVFCHKCQEAALKYLVNFDQEVIVFTDQGCIFVTELPRSIALNGLRKECLGRIPKKKCAK